MDVSCCPGATRSATRMTDGLSCANRRNSQLLPTRRRPYRLTGSRCGEAHQSSRRASSASRLTNSPTAAQRYRITAIHLAYAKVGYCAVSSPESGVPTHPLGASAASGGSAPFLRGSRGHVDLITLGQMGTTPDLLARRQNGDRRRPAVGDHVRNRVSEGGLEPPCPFGAIAPQASASAYSATRTECWGPPEYGGSPAATLPNGHPRPRRPAAAGGDRPRLSFTRLRHRGTACRRPNRCLRRVKWCQRWRFPRPRHRRLRSRR